MSPAWYRDSQKDALEWWSDGVLEEWEAATGLGDWLTG
jgi:hypothetical protein